MVVRQKVFAAYSTLKAQDVNDYLRDITVVSNISELSSLDGGIYMAWVALDKSLWANVAGTWRKQTGSPNLIYENGNLGSSGLVGSNTTAGIFNVTVTSPYASDAAHMHFMAAVGAGGGSAIGTINVYFGGVAYSQIYNVTTYSTAQFISVPVSLVAGANQLVFNLANGNGQPAGVTHAALRVTA